MAGGYYTALSGMRARMDTLDRIAADIANSSTTGYKTERGGTTEADRPSFGAALQSAVDVTTGEARVDMRPGAVTTTHRPMDVAIEGRGFFVVTTPQGERYTRNGHLARREDGVLTTDEGDPIQGASGDIKIGPGDVSVDPDGTVRNGGTVAGTLKLVQFDDTVKFSRDGASRFRADGEAKPVDKPSVAPGALEQSNVSIVDRVAELTDVRHNFEVLVKAVSVLMNDVDRGAITELGKR